MNTVLRRCMVIAMSIAVMLSFLPALNEVTDNDFGIVFADENQAYVTKDGVKFHLYYANGKSSVIAESFSGTNTQIVLPTSVTHEGVTYSVSDGTGFYAISESLFAGNTKITKVAIPDGYESIGKEAFNGCTSMTEVAIGDGIEYIAAGAFTGCPATTYYFKGEKVSQEQVENSGIGTDASGNPIAGVTVWTSEGSNVDKALKELNKTRPADKQIDLKYDNDPYSKHTVKPESSSGGGSTPEDQGSGSGSGGATPSDTGGGNDGSGPGTGDNGGSTATDPTAGMSNADKKSVDQIAKAVGTDKKTAADVLKYAKKNDVDVSTVKITEKTLKAIKDDKDVKGTKYGKLQAKVKKVTKSAVTLQWKKVKGASGYIVYGTTCNAKGKVYKVKKLKTLKSNKTSYTHKKLKKGTYYKYIVVAYRNFSGKKVTISSGSMIHVATKGGKFTNYKAVVVQAKINAKGKTIKKLAPLSKTQLKKGKKVTLKVKGTKESAKLKASDHRKISFESSNTKILKVNSKGVVTAVKKGKAKIYVFAQNGVSKTVTITVK